jgi:hypothetical protein
MKTVTVTADQYEQILYLACATASVENIQELRMTNKVLDKLESVGLKKPQDQGFKLIDATATLQFEDAEAEYVIARIENVIPNLQAWKARECLAIVDQLMGTFDENGIRHDSDDD